MRLVVFGQLPLVAEYLTRVLVQPLALADMEMGSTASDGKVLNGMVLTKTMRDDGRVLLVLTHLDLLLVEPYVKTSIGLLKLGNIKIVYQHIGKDGTQQLGMIHAAKLTLYS